MTSANEGIGVPSRPVMKSYRDHGCRAALEAGALGKIVRPNRLIVAVRERGSGGPSPRLRGHGLPAFSLVKSSFPCLMLSKVSAGSAGTLMISPGLSVFQRGEKVLMKATMSARCCLVREIHAGMFELLNPRPTEL